MVVATVAFSVAMVFAAEKTWTRSEILAIADEEAGRRGINVEQMSVSFDLSNSCWNESREAFFKTYPSLEKKLQDTEY